MRRSAAAVVAVVGMALIAAPAAAVGSTGGEAKPGGPPTQTSSHIVAPVVESLIVSYSAGYAPVTPQGEVTGAEHLPDVTLVDGEDIGFGMRTVDFSSAIPVEAAEAVAAALAASPAVSWAEPDYRVRVADAIETQTLQPWAAGTATADALTANTAHATVEPTSRQVAPPWGLDRIDQRTGLDGRYNYDTTGSGVTVYTVDTGVRSSHREFAGRVLRGAYTIADGRGVEDCHGHGTHVAGTIAGNTYGIAKAAQIVPVRVLDCDNSGLVSDLVTALDWIVADHPDNTPAVANLSLGTPPSNAVDEAVRRTILDNITVVVASGNDATDACHQSPARVSDAITVNASTELDDDAHFSNFGPCTDIYAPGTGIVSANHTSDTATRTMDGTSMAAPHVTGAVARLLSMAPGMTPAQVWQRLSQQGTAIDFLPEIPNDAKLLLHVPPPPAAPPAAVFVPIDPVRVLDTRPAQGGAGALGSGETRSASVVSQIARQGGAQGVVPPGALAVAYNLTVPAGWSSGHLRVMPGDAPLTSASAINFRAGSTIANGLVTRVDGQRRIKIHNAAHAPTNTIVDVVGYFMPAAAAPTGGRFNAVTPVRVYDAGDSPLAPGTARKISVANQLPSHGGATNVVPTGSEALAYNITVVRPGGSGHLRVFPGDRATSDTSTINWTGAGDVVANGLQVRLATDRTIRVFNSSGVPVHFLVDVVGYYRSGTGGFFHATDPARAYDSRAPIPTPGALGGGGGQLLRTVTVANGRDSNGHLESLSVVPSGATAIAYNLTSTSTVAAGHLRVFPASVPLVGASAINWPGAGLTRANGSIVAVSPDRRVNIYNGSSGDAHAVVDILGYYR